MRLSSDKSNHTGTESGRPAGLTVVSHAMRFAWSRVSTRARRSFGRSAVKSIDPHNVRVLRGSEADCGCLLHSLESLGFVHPTRVPTESRRGRTLFNTRPRNVTTPGGNMRLLLTSAGVNNTSIHDALVD